MDRSRYHVWCSSSLLQLLAELQESYKLRRTLLCGGSMGGTAALIFAHLHPHLVAGVVAMNGTANMVEYNNFQEAISASYGGTKAYVADEYQRRSVELRPGRLTMPLGLTLSDDDIVVPPHSMLRVAKYLAERQHPLLLIRRTAAGHATSYDDARAILTFVEGESKGTENNQQGKRI